MSSAKQYPNSRIVQTSDGKIQGHRLIYEGDRQVDAFQGIPFAAPPIGELRFKKPQPPARWSGVREAKAFSSRPIQLSKFKDDFKINGVPSEDCLYLNVFTPCWNPLSVGFPVMFFIPGGKFEHGEAKSYGDTNICENIVSRGIVFVTIQYRVGYLGFFTTGDNVCPGNLGLWDQTVSLRWVQSNIGAFAGDPNNVTVVGQSAGGASADFLHLSPHSTGLFHKIICMAGNAECRWTSNEVMPIHCRNKARLLGVHSYNSDEIISQLRRVPADKFSVNYKEDLKEEEVDLETVPYIDGDFFPASFDELRAKARPKPMMTGVTKEEGSLMRLFHFESDHSNSLAVLFYENEWAYANRTIYRALSRHIDRLEEGSDEFARAMANLASDYYFNAGTLELCRKTVQIQKEPVYLYTLEHFNPEVLGIFLKFLIVPDVTHTCDLFYLFARATFADFFPEITNTERLVIDRFTTALTNFATYGDPNGAFGESSLPTRWEPVSRSNYSRNYVFTTETCAMRETFFEGRTAKFMRIINENRSNSYRSSL
ncbi:hypothetical protein PENTCL1PPCAC_111 [Pristionchus entomophagus]|uniref:Carboxylesterase type B domain-containing protein n=1 Tax=Pristionchus entomophagus TaxID=358040 RepID=A0AAV5S5X0_9BILA|nr:hypothetical protein PENTCL1PPCAC_111 [Pristionchus entomophagus]